MVSYTAMGGALICGTFHRHVHVSLRDKDGRNIFAVSESEREAGRTNAAYKDTKFLSQEGEWFVAGVLDGIADGRYSSSFLVRSHFVHPQANSHASGIRLSLKSTIPLLT